VAEKRILDIVISILAHVGALKSTLVTIVLSIFHINTNYPLSMISNTWVKAKEEERKSAMRGSRSISLGAKSQQSARESIGPLPEVGSPSTL